MEELWSELLGDAAEQPRAGLEHPCGLDGARPLAPGQMGHGMVVTVDGQMYDLGMSSTDSAASAPGSASSSVLESESASSSITLADDRGLSIYSDIDGDGTVDQVTTVLFDGSWETWKADASIGEGNEAGGAAGRSIGDWGAYEWEEATRGRWG